MLSGLLLSLWSCQNNASDADAFGNFEAEEALISAEVSGRLVKFNIDEGQILALNQSVGKIDTADLYLKKLQLQSQIQATQANFDQIEAQLEVQKQQLSNVEVTRNRTRKLLDEQAATQKQYDEVEGQYQLSQKQIRSVESQKTALHLQIQSMYEQLRQIELNLHKCYLPNPVEGTVLNTFAQQGEISTPGKVLYSIADLRYLKLKAYVSGNQLSRCVLGKKVQVSIDQAEGALKTMEGEIIWISPTAEFTPKTIQTREERVNLVYAFKVRVKNDGSLKIGMPAEVRF